MTKPYRNLLVFYLFWAFLCVQHVFGSEKDEILVTAAVGHNISLACNVTGTVSWLKDGVNITNVDKRYEIVSASHPIEASNENEVHPRLQSHILNLNKIELSDTGNFTCFDHSVNSTNVTYTVQAILPPKIVAHSARVIRRNITQGVMFFCTFKVHPEKYFDHLISWKVEETDTNEDGDTSDHLKLMQMVKNNTKIIRIDEKIVNVTLDIENLNKKHNGTYICSVEKPAHIDEDVNYESFSATLLVMDRPQLLIDYTKAVGAGKIYMNWTINDGNDPVKVYILSYLKEGASSRQYYWEQLKGGNISHVFSGFERNSTYDLNLCAKNNWGESCYTSKVKTLEKDPVFVPKLEVKGMTHSTMTIGWAPPSNELLDYFQYYVVKAFLAGNESSAVEESNHPHNSRNLPYMFDNLKVATEYSFQVKACSELTQECGEWSEIVNGTTMDGMASPPLDLKLRCIQFDVSLRNRIEVEFSPPTTPNGILVNYQVILTGTSSYRQDKRIRNDTYGPKAKIIDVAERKLQFEPVPPNTNYTVSVAGITRSRRPGESAEIKCTMPPSRADYSARLNWGKVKEQNGDWVFKLFLPRASERNGPVCCYRIYMVRLGDNSMLTSMPDELDVMSYAEAHATNNTRGGAYIAEILMPEDYHSEVLLGDGKQVESTGACKSCYQNLQRKIPRKVPTAAPTEEGPTTTATTILPITTIIPPQARRRRQNEPEPSNNPVMTINQPLIFDGALNLNSNYTGFVEVIVERNEEAIPFFSEYFETMKAGAPDFPATDMWDMEAFLNISVTILCGLILVVVVLLSTLCLLHRYYSKNSAQADEVYTLTDSLRAFCYGRSSSNQHRHLITSAPIKPPDMPPIARDDLPEAWQQRHKDSDYGFQHEFEMLPDRFSDRTTKNSDLKDNLNKNRYPDIKSYDQTRVRLAMLNSTIGSDYINANFVIGYKERKKFICAQGPMESTVNDFWRMIWEQHLEIILMLTNLEEYNKNKCARYWPEKTSTTQFGEFNVHFVAENRFSDYMIRELRVTKRNGSGEEIETPRTITQYHYLNWKDFMAPEHPYGIIKFIRTINSVYSVQRGPILVHCSAGVGRTGTLVALDSMMQQLNEEGQVSVFNTICDLRHQRNFLVQSLKQYIFLYRALLDIAQFGDTEIPYKGMNGHIENLKQSSSNSKGQCKMEIEYEKIKSLTDDIRKTCAVGSGEENSSKNRSQLVIPFDRNRVILPPLPGIGHSTYINASFIEGYDNTESFIITQDPMESTIADFWRMILEQGVDTIVMISEIGDAPNKCPRYWADDEIQYEHIKIKYIQSESGPYYTRREFVVSSVKNSEDTIQVTQFQYQGWPTVENEVPEVTRGICEIVNQAQKHHKNQQQRNDYMQSAPVLVHCSIGTDKSSIFVAMCILIQQLRLEKKVDVCTTTRKLRSQRNMMIDSYAQYEFLHRAIVNYADLHKTSLDSLSSASAVES